MTNNNTRKLVQTGVFAALIFVATMYIKIDVVLPTGPAMFKTGNVLCVLAGMLLGKVHGGLAAGIGSALFDLMNPLYIASTPYTFVFFFLMAFFAGLVYEKTKNVTFSAFIGAYSYVLMYFSKKTIEWLLNTHGFGFWTWEQIQISMTTNYPNLGVSLMNATFAVICSGILFPEIKKRLFN